ncbi:DUF2934 domain-containing protein [Rhizobium sp. SGZ-381]|uniref:DUF2934 domain-containing protein n=1 Tax=Rhizobium sp. SGZ-381 TaxID=3342800 RepID=UPI00366C1487
MADSEEWIRNRAYALWEADGYTHGKDAEHWEQARREFEAAGASGKKGAKASAAKTNTSKSIAVEPAPTDPVIDTAPAKAKPKAAAKAAAAPAKTRAVKKTGH